MGGGLLNLISKGSHDIILTGNPDITFFKHVYKKHTNYGLQYFRLDYDGIRNLNYKTDTIIEFDVPRHADLIGETYFVINLPDIYSQPPIYNNKYCPKFKWIHDLGYNMIKKATISIGGQKINEYSGEYFINLRDREYSRDKKEKINQMTGNVPELYDPASKYGGVYPNAFKSTNFEPSIRGRKLYIPIDCWFGHNSYANLPLVALQYQVVHIRLELRPINELYVVSSELLDEYSENFLFNEFPAMHNINFLLKSSSISDHALCDDIKSQITRNFINYKNNITPSLFNVVYPSTDPLTQAVQEYSGALISFIQNGGSELPQTYQHIGNDTPDITTDPDAVIAQNLFKVRVHNIDHSEYYKVYIYIDYKNINPEVDVGPETYLKTEPFLTNIILQNLSVFNIEDIAVNTVSFFQSTDVDIEEADKKFNISTPFPKISKNFPGDISCNHPSNNRNLLQNQYLGTVKREKYVAPDHLSILDETTLFDTTDPNSSNNTDTYTISELLGQAEASIDFFTLDNKSKHNAKSWNADMHLVSKYVFLDEEERINVAKNQQSYLIKTIYEEEFNALSVPNTIKINSKDLVINYTWIFRRSDAFLRNEWSNYTNWEFIDVPNTPLSNEFDGITYPFFLTPFIGNNTTNNDNKKTILQSLSIFVDGKMRENLFEQGVYNYLEKYLKCTGQGKDGQYFYSFALNNSPTDLQPSGIMNLSKFNEISFNFTLIETPDDPNFDPTTVTKTILQTRENGAAPICVSTTTKKDHIKLYSFDMKTFQERYNVLTFNAGMGGLMYAR